MEKIFGYLCLAAIIIGLGGWVLDKILPDFMVEGGSEVLREAGDGVDSVREGVDDVMKPAVEWSEESVKNRSIEKWIQNIGGLDKKYRQKQPAPEPQR